MTGLTNGQLLELLFTAMTAVAGFFASIWIYGIREDVRLAVRSINEHASRITRLETNLLVAQGEVEKLRRRLEAI